MDKRSRDRVARVAFVLSLLVLVLLYGWGARGFGWFPDSLILRALQQADAHNPFSPPDFYQDPTYDASGARTAVSGAVQPGLTLITAAWPHDGRPTPGLRLIDRDGEIVHEWRVDPSELFPESPTTRRAVRNLDIQGSYLFPNGDVLVNVEYAGTLRLDACGRVRWRLLEGGHHSIARAMDGSFWIPGVTPEPRSASPGHPDGFPGLTEPVYQDLILHIAEDGSVLERLNVLDLLYRNGLEWHLVDERRTGHDDPTHLNDVEPLPASLADEYPGFEAGDLVVSLRHLDLVFVLDPRSRRVKWHASEPFIMQHDPDFLGEGWIGVFDNRRDGTARGTMLGGSRIVALQPHTDSMRVLFPGPASEPFYTHHRGKWQMLENGNLLLVESAAGRVVEVGLDGGTVWEWIAEPYEDWGVPSVTGAARVDITREEVASWSCAGGRPVGDAP
jgi:hypothetical protein